MLNYTSIYNKRIKRQFPKKLLVTNLPHKLTLVRSFCSFFSFFLIEPSSRKTGKAISRCSRFPLTFMSFEWVKIPCIEYITNFSWQNYQLSNERQRDFSNGSRLDFSHFHWLHCNISPRYTSWFLFHDVLQSRVSSYSALVPISSTTLPTTWSFMTRKRNNMDFPRSLVVTTSTIAFLVHFDLLLIFRGFFINLKHLLARMDCEDIAIYKGRDERNY